MSFWVLLALTVAIVSGVAAVVATLLAVAETTGAMREGGDLISPRVSHGRPSGYSDGLNSDFSSTTEQQLRLKQKNDKIRKMVDELDDCRKTIKALDSDKERLSASIQQQRKELDQTQQSQGQYQQSQQGLQSQLEQARQRISEMSAHVERLGAFVDERVLLKGFTPSPVRSRNEALSEQICESHPFLWRASVLSDGNRHVVELSLVVSDGAAIHELSTEQQSYLSLCFDWEVNFSVVERTEQPCRFSLPLERAKLFFDNAIDSFSLDEGRVAKGRLVMQ